METSAPGEAGPPKQKKRKKSQPASLVETSPALPPGWDLVRTCSSGEILFLHLESLQCQRERPRQPEEDQHSDKEEQGGQEETLSKAGACTCNEILSIIEGTERRVVQMLNSLCDEI